MEQHEMSGLEDMRGQVSLHDVADPQALERAGYIRTLQSWGKERHAHHPDKSGTHTT